MQLEYLSFYSGFFSSENKPGHKNAPLGTLALTLTLPYVMAACVVTFPDMIGGRISWPYADLRHPLLTPFVQVCHIPE